MPPGIRVPQCLEVWAVSGGGHGRSGIEVGRGCGENHLRTRAGL